MTTAELTGLADRIVPILVFVLGITVVAELADRIGVFAVLAHRVAGLAGGVVWRLWLLIAALAVAATVVLSLDTTAVLLTPVVLALAGQLKVDRGLFAYTAVWLANTASLLLPVSNLTNLLSLHVLELSAARFLVLTAPAAIAAVVITLGVLAVIFRRSLRGRYRRGDHPEVHEDRPLLGLAMGICLLLGPLFAVGLNVAIVSTAAAVILVVACAVRDRGLLSWRLVPWPLLLGVSVLFVVVEIAHDHGLGAALAIAAGATGAGFVELLRLAGMSGLAANLADNLPAYLAMEPVAAGSPVRMVALLIGVNTAPLITPWASLATLLWASRCRSAGVSIRWSVFALRGLILVPLLLLGCVGATVLVHGN